MTGLVVVSHSRALADAAIALASEMLHGADVRIEVAAGLDASTFGTDATAIVEAITRADDGDGVVVLMDLGSALLSTEMALDMVEAHVRDRTILCPGPLVEGLVVAAVAAAGGASPAEVASEAIGSLAAKQSHLGASRDGVVQTGVDEPHTASYSAIVKIGNRHGLHARPAARLVQEARLYDARVELRNLETGAGPVPATSLSRVATLGALCGHRVEVSATGGQAREAVDHVVALAERRFDEVEVPESELPARPVAPPTNAAGPLAASPGIAIGPVLRLHIKHATVPDIPTGDAAAEWRRVRAAVADVRRDIQRVRVAAAREVGEQEARIFDAHLMLVDDADLLEKVHDRIRSGADAVRSWSEAVTAVQSEFASVDDPYLRARAADVEAVGQQVARALAGAPAVRVDGDGVLVAQDLTPAQVAELDPSRVRGIVLAAGSPTGHSAILARSRAIPAVVAAGPGVLAVAEGTTVALDGGAGSLFVDPDEATTEVLRARAERAREEAARALTQAALPAHTVDGIGVEVGANLGSVADARAAVVNGADLAGLVRTEFLYLDRREPPTVDEQIGIYRSLAEALGSRRLVLRTLDVGGDKPVPYLPQPREANPFLGIRGIRLTLAHRQLFADQLRAIVEVAHETPVSVMFPMVSTVEELLVARRLLDEVVASHRGGPPPGLTVGMMVEVPAAALKAASFADHVDFFSIGTNDLTQYTLAAERGNPSLARLADPLDPGVLRLVDVVCRAAAGRADVAVCGEVAADETAAALLVALGVRELSVTPSAVPAVKQAVRRVESGDNPGLVHRCLAAASPDEVRSLLRP